MGNTCTCILNEKNTPFFIIINNLLKVLYNCSYSDGKYMYMYIEWKTHSFFYNYQQLAQSFFGGGGGGGKGGGRGRGGLRYEIIHQDAKFD